METNGICPDRMTADATFASPNMEAHRMHVHVDAHLARLLRQAAAERLAAAGRSDPAAAAQPGILRRLRRRLGRAIIGLGRSVEGAGHGSEVATA